MFIRKYTSMILMILILAVSLSGWSISFKGVGIIVDMTGECEYQAGNKATGDWIELKEAQDIFMGDTILTGEDGKVKILFSDEKTHFTIGNDSEISIDEFVYNPEQNKRKSQFDLVKGKMRIMLQEGNNAQSQVRTKTAVIGVKGTHFITEVLGEKHTRVTMVKGLASVENASAGIGGQIMLKSQMATDVFTGKTPSMPKVESLRKIQSLIRQTTVQSPPAGHQDVQIDSLEVAPRLNSTIVTETPVEAVEDHHDENHQPIIPPYPEY